MARGGGTGTPGAAKQAKRKAGPFTSPMIKRSSGRRWPSGKAACPPSGSPKAWASPPRACGRGGGSSPGRTPRRPPRRRASCPPSRRPPRNCRPKCVGCARSFRGSPTRATLHVDLFHKSREDRMLPLEMEAVAAAAASQISAVGRRKARRVRADARSRTGGRAACEPPAGRGQARSQTEAGHRGPAAGAAHSCRRKVFRLLGERYRNRRKRFGLCLNLIAALTNLQS